MTTQIVAKPSGVVTEPNKIGQFPPGAFSSCMNVAIRSFGVMEQVAKFADLASTTFLGPLVGGLYFLSEGPTSILLYEHTALGTWAIMGIQANNFGGYGVDHQAVTSPWQGYITNDCRTGMFLMRNRLIVSGTVRSFAFDLTTSVGGSISIAGPRDCGVYQTTLANRGSGTASADDPAYVGPNQHFSATSVMRFKFSDGYELQGPPAVPSDYANLSTTLPQAYSYWTVYSAVQAGAVPSEYKLDIYRTRSQSVGYDSVNNKYLPISTGSSFYLSKTVNRSATTQFIYDTTLPSTLGEALLTNVSVGGASALPLPPPPTAKTCAVFRGHAFYANRFDPATFTLLNPYFWGFMNLATATTSVLFYGIGTRFTDSGQSSVSGNPTVTGLPNTFGVVAGQTFNVYRVDTGVLVTSNNEVLSTTATTVTGTTNVSYTGAVRVEFLDRIEICGTNRAALNSPQNFVAQLFFPGAGQLNTILDVAAVGLEPITPESQVGVYPNFVPTGGITFRMRTNDPFTIRATNSQNFSPQPGGIAGQPLTIPGRQQENGFAWSENNEPENVPPSNYAFAGSGEIYKIIPTRDCLWFFCSDGLYRLSGAGGSVGEEYDWVIDPVDLSLVIANPMCAVAYREYVYAYTNRGFVSISSEGVIRELSDGRINPAFPAGGGGEELALQNRPWRIPVSPPAISSWPWVAVDAANDELWVRSLQGNNFNSDKIWVYNTKTDTWCIRVPSHYIPAPIPQIAVYSSISQVVLTVFTSGTNVVVSKPIGISVDYEIASATFQPLYGGSHGAPYTQKHWQDINLSFRTPQSSSVASCIVQSQSDSGLIAGSRLIPVGTALAQTGDTARIGFTIPRAWPALANSISPTLVITSPSASGPVAGLQPIKFEGMQVSYIDFTEQRIKR